jgi:hypothetical protein
MTRRAAVIAMVAACTLAAAGPAAAAAAAPSAQAAGTPGNAVSRLLAPGARWLRSGLRPGTAGERTMIAQATAAAATTGAELFGVSCTGKAECTATGLVTTRSGANARTLAERWNGTKWVVQSTPTPLSSGRLGGLLSGGVSCTSSHACVADGYSYSKSKLTLLGETWNGARWTVQPLAKPGLQVMPGGISCTWAKNCMLGGLRLSGATLAEHWNGRKWSPLTTPKYGQLFGMTCPATGNCTTSGLTSTGKALVEHWNGHTWSVQSTASPNGINPLLAVSCHPVGSCLAVGTTGRQDLSSLAPLAEVKTGSTWAATGSTAAPGTSAPVDPTPGDLAEFNSVSCTSATNCMAVGDAGDSAGTSDATLAELWNGSTWTVEATVDPATFSTLTSVSCTSASHCVAVGADSASATGSIHTLVEVWNGSTWTQQTAPN